MSTVALVPVVHPRLRRMVTIWFDFQISSKEKAVLLQAFPRLVPLIRAYHPELTDEAAQPRGKEAICQTLALMFTETLSECDQMRVRSDPQLPKHFKQAEMGDFLKRVAETARNVQHCVPSYNR